MKVLLINGSPHRHGCTYTALTEVASVLEEEGIETEIFWIGNKPISGCIACKQCAKTGYCAIDDTVNECLKKARSTDGFIFGTPVHYSAVSGAMTSFMDRLFYADSRAGTRTFALKPAACVISTRRAGATATFDQMNKYFTNREMPIISSFYWNMVHGTNPEEVRQDVEGISTMRVLARNMAFFLKCKQVAMEHGVALPKQEPIARMNFIH